LEQYGAASECYARAEALLSKAGETGLLCPVLIGMGLVAKKNNQYDSAKALYQRALASQKQGTAKWAGKSSLLHSMFVSNLVFFLSQQKLHTTWQTC
jgi:Tfp pilus assembly protein PilF